MSSRYSVFNSTLHGSGVQADAFIPVGDVVLQEKPLHFLQTIPNRKSVIVCGSCLKPLGNLPMQIGALQGVISRENMVEEFEGSMATSAISDYCCRVVPCPCNCGEMYCSEACRDVHWAVQGHRLLCTGHITDEEAEFHPLIAYKIHAMSSNEIFLMAADVFAAIVCQLDNLITSGVELAQAFEHASKPLAGYVRELWWDAAITPKGYKPLAFKKSLKTLIKDTWELLNEALQLESKGYTSFLSEEYLSRTIGMFEQNNVGVQMRTPLSEYVQRIVAPDTAADPVTTAYVLEASQRILDNIDDDAMCCDDDEGEEGEYEDIDVDDEEEGEEEESMEEATSEDIPTAEDTTEPSLAALRGMIAEHGLDTLYPPLDGTAFYSTICRINHSCDPNVRVTYVSHPERGLLATLIALQPIQPGEELVQSYIDQYQSLEVRRKALKDYGFVCTCTKCSTESTTMAQSGIKA